MDRCTAIEIARGTEKGMELYKGLVSLEKTLNREYEESAKSPDDFKAFQETLGVMYDMFIARVAALPVATRRLTGSKRFFEEIDTQNSSLSASVPTKDFLSVSTSDGIKTLFNPKFTADTVAAECKTGEPITNTFPAPTVDRPRELITLAALVDIASYFGQVLMIAFYINILLHMASTYLPVSSQREQALAFIAEFGSMISGTVVNLHAPKQKLMSILRLFYDEQKPAVGDANKSGSQTHLNFRTSHWVLQSTDRLLKALNLKK